MAAMMDSTTTSGSLTARRPAAGNLPLMNLPPLPFRQNSPSKSVGNGFNPSQSNVSSAGNPGNLLTPPTNLSGDITLSPLTGLNNNNADLSTSQGIQSFGQGSPSWLQQAQGQAPFNMRTGTTPQAWTHGIKGLFSPPIAGINQRHSSNSPTAQDSLPNALPPPPPFSDLGQHPNFSNNLPSSIPTAMANQQAFAHNAFMAQLSPGSMTTPGSGNALNSPAMNGAQQLNVNRPSSTPNAYPFAQSQPGSAQANAFPMFPVSSPSQQSPMSAPLPGSDKLSPGIGPQSTFAMPNGQLARGYSMPTYGGPYAVTMPNGQVQLQNPVMSNMNAPGAQMTLMGMPPGIPQMHGYHSGHAAQMYGGQANPHNDRPFKCDQCPQSFNRNHDLKRHKRIHLAVKPFPCGWCDKSFSRKDALKRHILVKGCGTKETKQESDNGSRRRHSLGPVDDDDDEIPDADM